MFLRSNEVDSEASISQLCNTYVQEKCTYVYTVGLSARSMIRNNRPFKVIDIDKDRNSWTFQIEVERRIINNIPIQATKNGL